MHTRWLKGVTLAVACAAAPALAQDRPAQSPGVSKITLTGCVERADQVSSREALGTTIDSLTFVLINAQEGTAQEKAPPADKDAGKTYRLDADTDTINPHVGHRVEIVGSMASPAGNAPVGTSGGSDAGTPAPLLVKVESVKMLSSTCSR